MARRQRTPQPGAIYLVSTHGFYDVDRETASVSTAGRPDTGGQTVYVVELAKALGRAGYPTFLVVRWFNPTLPELQQIGPNCWILRLRAGDWEFVPKERIYSKLPSVVDNLAGFVQEEWREMFAEAGLVLPASVQPWLLHGHYVDAGVVAEQCARHFKVQFFWTSHSLGALKRERMGGDLDKADAKFNFPLRIEHETGLIRRTQEAGGLTVTAKTEVADIARLYGLTVEAQFIPPGVDVAKFRPLLPGEEETPFYGLPAHGPIVLMGGRVAKTKGYTLAMAAFRQVLVSCPDANLVIFGGSDNPSEEERDVLRELDDFREAHRIARKVFFLGAQPQDRLPALYRRAQVFLLPSRHEPFGMVVLEAAACGVPVVVSTHAGIASELQDGVDGLLVDPLDTLAFSEAISGLLQDPERARRIAEAGRVTVNGRYSWDGLAQTHLEFWRSRGVRI